MITNKYYNAVFSFLKNQYYFIFEKVSLPIVRLISNYSKINSDADEKPLVSIIIATYNRSEILFNRTLPSILNQSYQNIEVIVVGDKCIDNTPLLFTKFHDKRVKFYDLKKRGNYPVGVKYRWFVQGTAPRNKGMKLASGDWFVFISDDDVLYPTHVETLLRNALRQNVEFLSASYDTVKNGEKITVHPVCFWNKSKCIKIGGMQTWIYKSHLKIFKWNIDSWRKNWDRPVDYDLQLRFLKAGVKMGYINDVVYYNPPVEGTNTTGYEAALIADKLD